MNQVKDTFRILARSSAEEQKLQELSIEEMEGVSGAGTGSVSAKVSSGRPPDKEVSADANWTW